MAGRKKQSTEAAVREIRRRTRRKFAPEEKIRIVLEGLRGEVECHASTMVRLGAGRAKATRVRSRSKPVENGVGIIPIRCDISPRLRQFASKQPA